MGAYDRTYDILDNGSVVHIVTDHALIQSAHHTHFTSSPLVSLHVASVFQIYKCG